MMYCHRYQVGVTRPRGGGTRISSNSVASSTGAAKVVSPMPGKVVRVMASAGQEVKKVGQATKRC